MDSPKKPPHWQGTEAEWRRPRANNLFEVEVALREEGMGDPALTFDEDTQVFRFAYDGVFAFSREHVNWPELLQREGCWRDELLAPTLKRL